MPCTARRAGGCRRCPLPGWHLCAPERASERTSDGAEARPSPRLDSARGGPGTAGTGNAGSPARGSPSVCPPAGAVRLSPGTAGSPPRPAPARAGCPRAAVPAGAAEFVLSRSGLTCGGRHSTPGSGVAHSPAAEAGASFSRGTATQELVHAPSVASTSGVPVWPVANLDLGHKDLQQAQHRSWCTRARQIRSLAQDAWRAPQVFQWNPVAGPGPAATPATAAASSWASSCPWRARTSRRSGSG